MITATIWLYTTFFATGDGTLERDPRWFSALRIALALAAAALATLAVNR